MTFFKSVVFGENARFYLRKNTVYKHTYDLKIIC